MSRSGSDLDVQPGIRARGSGGTPCPSSLTSFPMVCQSRTLAGGGEGGPGLWERCDREAPGPRFSAKQRLTNGAAGSMML